MRPAEARQDLLPEGFSFDPGWKWIQSVHFGREALKRTEETLRKREMAKELGFDDEQSLNDAAWFASLAQDERDQFKREYECRVQTDLPENEPGNPGRRVVRVSEEAGEAPGRVTEKRSRSVSVGYEAVKKDAVPYLRQQYTNSDGEMICQICKIPLPFKLPDGNYYFEAVEFLGELENRHFQNYLSLCPNHAAMFQYANGAQELIKELFIDLDSNELDVVLAEEDATIYFTKTHIMDLQAVIASGDGDPLNEKKKGEV